MSLTEIPDLLKALSEKWATKTALATALILIFGLLVWVQKLLASGEIAWPQLAISAISIPIVTGLWFFSRRVPRVPPNTLGFVIAITSDDENERKRVLWDFVPAVRDALSRAETHYKFSVIELAKHHAEMISDADAAQRYRRKCRSHFLLFGRALIRKVRGVDHHCLKLTGLVTHRRINLNLSKQLSKEMNAVLPLNVRIACTDDLEGFEVTSIWFAEAAKFIVATAALLSGDYIIAKDLLEDLGGSLNRVRKHKKIPAINQLKRRVPQRLAETYGAIAREYYIRWRQNRNQDDLKIARDYAERQHRKVPGSIHHLTTDAIWLFVSRRDTIAAIRQLRRCAPKALNDPIWRLGVAFLEAYEGRLGDAVRTYDAAFALSPNVGLPFEVEEFMDWVLSLEPEKYQINFCLGYVNFHLKQDFQRARIDFEKFLSQRSNGNFENEAAIAERYIGEIGN